MKILMVNKFHYIKGGSETYYFALKKLLEEKGHEVIDFSMKDEKNFPSKYEKYFVDNVNYNGKSSPIQKVKMAAKIIYSVEAKKKIEQLIIDTKPDIAHLHIFQHQISPSILGVLKKYNIPIVYTAHDLSMICPNYKMLWHGKICEECKGGEFIKCTKKKCVKDSYIKSFISSSESYLHKWIKSYNLIDYVITPSFYYKRKFIEFGVSPDRVIHIPNFLDTKLIEIDKYEYENYFLYFGRLSEEKGILTLVKAMKNIKNKLYIVGTGELEDCVRDYISSNEIENIKMLGFKSGEELYSFVGNAKAVVLPSEWYENGPYSAIEALKLGTPLIGSNLGGIPELIDGNGYVFKAGNKNELHKVLKEFTQLGDEDFEVMQKKSVEIFLANHTDEKHYLEIDKIYKKCTS